MSELSIARSPGEGTKPSAARIQVVIPFRLTNYTNADLEKAAAYVNDFFNSEWYKKELAKLGAKPFYLSKNVLPSEFPGILSKALTFIPVVRVNVSKHRSSKVLAWVGNDSLAMNLNKTNIKRIVGSLAGSIGHELIHILDRFSPREFGHGSNTRTKAKEASAPYWHGTKIKEYVALRESGKIVGIG